MKKLIIYMLLSLVCISATAQRKTDPLDRGLVAVKKASGVFCSWRILAEEYYDVTYNIYRNGTKLNSEPLTVSNYTDASGTESNTYTVRAVVNGVEQSDSKTATVWATGRVAKGGSQPAEQPNYLSIQMQDVVDRNSNIVFCCCGSHTPSSDVAQNYSLNDCSVADLDGDGEVEIIVKRLNDSDANASDTYAHNSEIYSTSNTRAFVIIEAYKLNGTRLWWIDCGPNMVSLNSTEINAVAYDWDEDGKAEVIMRGADNMIIHKADGSVYNVGNMSYNCRSDFDHTNAQYAWTKIGSEYLMYLNGATANPYSITDFPLKRLESGETLASAWAEGNTKQAYGHRSSKYFFGAPVLDGRKASIFLARGIYTQTKMVALDVNSSTHELTTKWTWKCSTKGSQWYGQGNHNMTVADVDGDGCDEIVYGSMVIDNNGKGLSTTGLGHGDAAHTGDLDPFRKGMETFACNEDNPGHNYRNAATCEIYHRHTASSDDGRAMAGNFSNEYPGSIGASVTSGVLSLTTDEEISGLANGCFQKPWTPMSLNGIIYWDGDLCAEAFDSPGTASEGVVSKLGTRIMQSSGCKLNNDSKNNPCAQGDILGDWREELILRQSDNKALRVFTTTEPTSYRIPSLWFDPEYRQAMVWQMCAYNQPPHPSFFLGELEGVTAAPPALTNTGKTEIAADATITTDQDGKDLLVVVEPSKSTNNRYTIKYSGKIAPATLTINAPVIVSGNDNNSNITSTTYTCYLNNADGSSGFSGNMRLVKQGVGVLSMAKKTLGHAGQTDIWEGSLNFNGTFSSSKVWMNRHTTLNTDGGTFGGGIEMNYNSTLNVTNSATVSDLTLNYGSRVALTVASTSDATQNGQLNITGTLAVDKKNWQYGPTYLAPVLKVNSTSALAIGKYPIGTVSTVSGSLDDIIIEGNFASATKQTVRNENGTLYLQVYDENSEPDGGESTLVFTAAVQGGSNTAGTSVNQETHYYNGWGTSGWVAQAYLGFDVTVPAGKQIKTATLKFTSYCGGNYDGRQVGVYLLDKATASAFSTSNMSLSTASGTLVSTETDNRTETLKTVDASAAVKAVTTTGSTSRVVFQLGGAAAGATVYGYGSSEKAPILSITVEDAPASDSNPIDVTSSYIVDAGFDGAAVSGSSFGGWTWEKSNGSNGPQYPYNATAENTTACEFWNGTAASLTFDLSQTLSNLPVGTYKLTAKANNSFNGLDASEGGKAYLYAQVNNSENLNSVAVDYNSNAATEYSTYEVIFKVTEAGQPVKIGFKTGSQAMAARWFSCDDFTLTYYGTTSTKEVTGDASAVHIHSYVYTDNGDGTHNKVCACGDAVQNEAHSGECTGCNIYMLTDGTTYTNMQEHQYSNVYYTRTFSNTTWNALCVPFAINVTDYADQFDIAEVFAFCPYKDTNGDGDVTAEDDDMLIVFKKTEGNTVPGKPYLIRPKSETKYTITAADGQLYSATVGSVQCYTTKTRYTITGLYSPVSATAENHYYYVTANGIGYRTSGSVPIGAYRWFMVPESKDSYSTSTSSNVKALYGIAVIGEDLDDATAVRLIGANTITIEDGGIYTIQGVKIANGETLTPGIYIKNGRKYIVK